MTDTLTVLEPIQLSPAPKPRLASRQLRNEVHNMLRDVAFVLAQTRRVREEILEEQYSPRILRKAEADV